MHLTPFSPFFVALVLNTIDLTLEIVYLLMQNIKNTLKNNNLEWFETESKKINI